MAIGEISLSNLTGPRRDPTPIAVDIPSTSEVVPHLLELAEQHHWQFKNLAKFSGHLPSQLDIRGALVTKLPDDPIVKSLLGRGVPVVRLGMFPHFDDHLVPAVMTDRPEVGRLAVDHFAQRDFKHVAYVGREPWEYDRHMFDAFASHAKGLGIECHLRRLNIQKLKPLVTPERDLWRVRQDEFTYWIASLPKPVGLLCFSDFIADHYCDWVIEAGLRVPEDVALLGIGNDRFVCKSVTVPISSVAADHALIARTAVEMLSRLMVGEVLEKTTVMLPPAGIVTRQSTDVLAASDPVVVRALRFMWDHITEDLTVEQIARHLIMSRRTLEKAFNRELGRGINHVLQKRRLEKARELIDQTALPVGEIAQMFKFKSHTYFCRSFREAFGVSPTQRRQKATD
ncbi:MAG: helix-turn-helix domain-containing protein [Phycisphaera sp.]|nr:helix-turn-helix domain-containing protein [Phycisphaera sp.]